MYYIYIIRHISDFRLYVGQTIDPKTRWSSHKISANAVLNGRHWPNTIYLSRAMAKYGIENFEFQVVEEWNTKTEADDAEIFWIEYFRSRNNKYGFNIAPGGGGVGSGKDHPNYGKPASNRLFTDNQEQEICNKYTSERLSITKLGEKYNCHLSTINGILQRNGIEILGNKVLSKGRRHSKDTEFKKGQEAHNKLFSEEQEKEICRQYIEDKLNTVQLGKMYRCHKSVISRMLTRHGLSTRRGKLTPEQRNEILKDYAEFKSARKTAEKHGVNKSTVLRLVKKDRMSLCV